MYNKLQREFSDPMWSAGLSFPEEFEKARKSFEGIDFDRVGDKQTAIWAVLQTALTQALARPAKTKTGNVLHKIGNTLLTILPFLKLIKWKRQK